MKWLKKIVAQCVREELDEEYKRKSNQIRHVEETHNVDSAPIISFRIYSAQNGRILEFSKYDTIKDRTDRNIYVVSKDEDISEKISKCLSLELLR